MKKLIMMCIIEILFISTSLYAQRTTDIENSKDYTLISRFEGSIIEFYKETKWGAYKLPINDKGAIDFKNPQTLEGKVIRIQYTTSKDNNCEFVLQNYNAAFKKAGFTILISAGKEVLDASAWPYPFGFLYYGKGDWNDGMNNDKYGIGISSGGSKDHAFIAVHGKREWKDIYIIIYTQVCENFTLLTQDVIEVEAVETGMVTAENIAKGIQTDGHIAVYDILFETGKSDIKPESDATIKNVAEYMNANPTKKFYIVGHTDNVGDFAANMTLSENRAKAVLNDLITKYAVKAEQLKAYGVSSLAPIGTNTTEEGKAKNRRVDIVEQ